MILGNYIWAKWGSRAYDNPKKHRFSSNEWSKVFKPHRSIEIWLEIDPGHLDTPQDIKYYPWGVY